MKRTALPKAVLEHIALVQMKVAFGCASVAEVLLERVPRAPSAANWKIVGIRNERGLIITFNNAHRDVVRGITATQKNLHQHYDLLD